MSSEFMKKSVIIATHPDREAGPNPHLTPLGAEQAKEMKKRLPVQDGVPEVVCGTGRRHMETAGLCNYVPTRYSECVGGPESLIQIVGGRRLIVLADGTSIDEAAYTGVKDGAVGAIALVSALPAGSVVAAGRPLMIQLGFPQAKSGSIYFVEIEWTEGPTGCYYNPLKISPLYESP